MDDLYLHLDTGLPRDMQSQESIFRFIDQRVTHWGVWGLIFDTGSTFGARHTINGSSPMTPYDLDWIKARYPRQPNEKLLQYHDRCVQLAAKVKDMQSGIRPVRTFLKPKLL